MPPGSPKRNIKAASKADDEVAAGIARESLRGLPQAVKDLIVAVEAPTARRGKVCHWRGLRGRSRPSRVSTRLHRWHAAPSPAVVRSVVRPRLHLADRQWGSYARGPLELDGPSRDEAGSPPERCAISASHHATATARRPFRRRPTEVSQRYAPEGTCEPLRRGIREP